MRTYGGNYDFYEQARVIEAARREAEYARQQARLAKEGRFIERFKTHVAKAAQVQSRIKKLDKLEKIAEPRRIVEKHSIFRVPPRSGDDGSVSVGRARRTAAMSCTTTSADRSPQGALGRDG